MFRDLNIFNNSIIMSFYDTLQRLERLARMIELEHTGNAATIADQLDVSPRTVKNLLDQLRNLGGRG